MKFKKLDGVSAIMIILVITKILGFLKFRIIAQLFEVGTSLDVFWAAFAIPDMLFNVLVAGAINAAIIPVFSDVLHNKGKGNLKDLFKGINLLFIGSFMVFAIVVFIFAREIGDLLISSDSLHAILGSQSEITVVDLDLFTMLTRIMLLSPLFLGMSSIVTAYLQTHKKFFVTALAPLFYNIGTIVVALVLVKKFGFGVEGLAWGIVFGSMLHLLTQLPLFAKHIKASKRKVSERVKNIFAVFKGREMWKIIRLATPRVLGLFGEYVNVFVNTIISFTLSAGALSAYKFAYSLHLFPVQIFGGAISQVVLPNLAEYHIKGETQKFKDTFNKAIQQSMYLILPMASMFITLKLPLVRLVFGVGLFDWDATRLVAMNLAILSIAVVGQGLLAIILRAFYAIKETKALLIATFITILVNIAGSYLFTNFFSHYYDWRPILDQVFEQFVNMNGEGVLGIIKSLGGDLISWMTTRGTSDASVYGLSLSTSLSFFVEVFIASKLLNRKIEVITFKKTIKPLIPKVINSMITAGTMYFVFKNIDNLLDTTKTLNLVLLTVLTLIYGGIIYLLGSYVFKIPEVNIITNAYSRFKEFILNNLKKLKKNGKR